MSGDRIGLVLVSVYILLVPGANYLSGRLRKLRSANFKFDYSALDFVAIVILIGAFYIGWSISWEFCIVQLLFVIVTNLRGNNEVVQRMGASWYMTGAFYGLLFYALIYLGLNQYSFSIMFSLANIVPAFLVMIIVIATFYIDALVGIANTEDRGSNIFGRMLLFLICQVLAFSIYFYVATELKYSAYFTLLMAIPFLFIVWDKSRVAKNTTENISRTLNTALWLLPICQTLFFLYYFLETTQVIQAVMGGY